MNDEKLHRLLVGLPGSRAMLNTPALILDLDGLERNIARMASFAANTGLLLRPHAKTHKSPEIAKLQIEAGAVGICCAKLGEAEVMADHGVVEGLHLTSPIVSGSTLARLVALNTRTKNLTCVVDNPANARVLAAAATQAGKPLAVLIDIDPGTRRTGVTSAEAAVALLEVIRAEPALRYAGVQFYCGMQQHIADFQDRRTAIEERAGYARAVIEALTAVGGAPDIITGGGTGTYAIDGQLGLFTELQVGSYVFMDSQYLECDLLGDGAAPFEPTLMIDATVVSANTPGLATLDAGFKAFSTDAGQPVVFSGARPGTKYAFMGDEHGVLTLMAGDALNLSDRVTLLAPHCDPTVNLYDTYHVVQGDTLRALWTVAARGRSR